MNALAAGATGRVVRVRVRVRVRTVRLARRHQVLPPGFLLAGLRLPQPAQGCL